MINGIVIINKEKGYTSHDVCAKVRGILRQKKVGHTGTLDPDATGVLPVCLGNATKLCDVLTDKTKEYVATLLLGTVTDTLDIGGVVLSQNPVLVSEEEVREAVLSFLGKSMQIPPMYSALKQNGKKLYELARAGIEVERQPRPIEIFEIEILDINLPRVEIRILCSKGTYIRSLCDDIGKKLGCGACMENLVRTRVGSFLIENSIYSVFVGEEVIENIASPTPGIESIAHCPGICSNTLPPSRAFTLKVFTSGVSCRISVTTPI